jgi:hypothetical protein
VIETETGDQVQDLLGGVHVDVLVAAVDERHGERFLDAPTLHLGIPHQAQAQPVEVDLGELAERPLDPVRGQSPPGREARCRTVKRCSEL